jgi:hypothetical protein
MYVCRINHKCSSRQSKLIGPPVRVKTEKAQDKITREIYKYYIKVIPESNPLFYTRLLTENIDRGYSKYAIQPLTNALLLCHDSFNFTI